MEYGVANRNGKPGLEKAVGIVRTAWEEGIRFFDTAQAYGDSEAILGRCFKELGVGRVGQPTVISKLNPSIMPSDTDRIIREVDSSLDRLGLSQLWGLLLHRESWLEYGSRFLSQIVSKLKLEKKIENFGSSVYSPEKAIEALNMEEIDVIQLPFNVFDQRALDCGVFRIAEERNKKVFVRSVYLQGLLLLHTNQIPDQLSFSREALDAFNSFARNCEIPPKLLAMAFVIQKAPDAMIVIGAENPDQVKENVLLLSRAKEITPPDLGFLSARDSKLINPSLWFN
jgi:aryl-alcohol dehydrogenase-like predicted oxidoreductase